MLEKRSYLHFLLKNLPQACMEHLQEGILRHFIWKATPIGLHFWSQDMLNKHETSFCIQQPDIDPYLLITSTEVTSLTEKSQSSMHWRKNNLFKTTSEVHRYNFCSLSLYLRLLCAKKNVCTSVQNPKMKRCRITSTK